MVTIFYSAIRRGWAEFDRKRIAASEEFEEGNKRDRETERENGSVTVRTADSGRV